ncbi:hypothetical protein [Falsihalocynthiibacter arcticus]|uniref:Uncharacterized protein n=1 Tax=Falsihalocynthiibacter arcticus TaxID=1579316 RepID=A0A126UYY8_9RHOB|nr:hypothetical protein [Falsihalocynthiibacter arcticus]AML51107.1 hypothetical protein RC74_07335 [Falsihalocynthiibacter arcticus]
MRDTIGDAYRAFFEKISYCTTINDSNRARGPIHPIWQAVQERVESGLLASVRNGDNELASLVEAALKDLRNP